MSDFHRFAGELVEVDLDLLNLLLYNWTLLENLPAFVTLFNISPRCCLVGEIVHFSLLFEVAQGNQNVVIIFFFLYEVDLEPCVYTLDSELVIVYFSLFNIIRWSRLAEEINYITGTEILVFALVCQHVLWLTGDRSIPFTLTFVWRSEIERQRKEMGDTLYMWLMCVGSWVLCGYFATPF